MARYIRNITIAGASGNVGQALLPHLLSSTEPAFQVTVITRPASKAEFPTAPNLKVARGSLDDVDFLTSTLSGQDALIIALNSRIPPECSINLVKAAAVAKVPYILPSEFGSDPTNEVPNLDVPLMAAKTAVRELITDLGESSWIGVVTNAWIDGALKMGHPFSIDIRNRKAILLDGGDVKAPTTTVAQVGRAVAKLFSLPLEAEGEPSLDDFKNSFAYIKSFDMSQREILDGVQEVVGKEGWEVREQDSTTYIQTGKDKLAAGDLSGLANLFYGFLYKKEPHGYNGPPMNEILGLPKESFTEMVEGLVEALDS